MPRPKKSKIPPGAFLFGKDIFGKPKNQSSRILLKRLKVPPFTTLDARQGYWQERKRMWLSLGIKSELGRKNSKGAFGRVVEHLIPSIKPELEKKKTSLNTKQSIFDPVLTELMYGWFCPKNGSIIDPFAGGSVRGIIAHMLGYSYTGIELSEKQVKSNLKQAKEIIPDNIPNWIIGDSRRIKKLAPGEYDFIFGCPPYGDLEVYSDNPKDLSTLKYEDFITEYKKIVRRTCSMLKNNRFAVFVVGDYRKKDGEYIGFVHDTIKAFQEAGLKYFNEGIFITPVGTLMMRVSYFFGRTRFFGKSHQNVLVFFKGEKYKEACKEIGMI